MDELPRGWEEGGRGVGCESRLRVGSTFRLRKKLSFQTFFRPPVVEGEVVQKEKKLARTFKKKLKAEFWRQKHSRAKEQSIKPLSPTRKPASGFR